MRETSGGIEEGAIRMICMSFFSRSDTAQRALRDLQLTYDYLGLTDQEELVRPLLSEFANRWFSGDCREGFFEGLNP